MNEFPILRLELDRMKQSMLVALADYHVSLSENVREQMEKIISEFDYEEEVGKATTEAIEEAINYYFKYGNGRVVIREAVQESFDKSLGVIK